MHFNTYTIFMKTYFIIFTLIIAQISFAQQDTSKTDDEFKTIFQKKSKVKVSGFGAVILDFGSIENDFSLLVGGEGAVLFNRKFYIGLYGRILSTLPRYEYINSNFGNRYNIQRMGSFEHGGLLLGYVFMPKKPIHFGISSKFGGGALGVMYYYNNYYNEPNLYLPEDTYEFVFVITPQIELEMNLTNWFKFRISAGYQYVSSATVDVPVLQDGALIIENGEIVKEELINSKNYNTPVVSVGFIFGWFK